MKQQGTQLMRPETPQLLIQSAEKRMADARTLLEKKEAETYLNMLKERHPAKYWKLRDRWVELRLMLTDNKCQ